ncbi:hypothetical protein JL722_8889 [Aureococcus anophagefferens]|nr:hypothetical protein JL722_8889 [Aureococcus anophagefferens]
MEVRRSTVGVYEDSLACQLLGQTYYVHPDKTIKITVDLVVTSEVIGALDDGHLIVELKYLQAMHVKNRMLKKCCYTLYLLELADRLRAEASRETLKTARKNVVEFDMVVLARPTLARVIRKFANAIARKAAEARGETFVPTPYDETAVDAVVVTAVPPVAPVVAPEPAPPAVSAPAGPPLKALEGMSTKECLAELYAAGVPKKGVTKHVGNVVLRDLVRRLRAGEPAASLKVPRKPKSAEELFCLDKAEQLACRETPYAQPECGVRYPYGSKLGLFKGRVGGGVRGFERFASFSSARPRDSTLRFDAGRETSARSSASAAASGPSAPRGQEFPNLLKALATVPRVDVNDMETLRARARRVRVRIRMCYRVIRDAKRRVGGHGPRAEDDQCPAYYGVDYRTAHGKPCAVYTVHEGTKTLRAASAPADRRRSRERFYGIDDRDCAKGKVVALAQIPGGYHAMIVFGTYDSKVEVSIQEKNRISEVVVARIEEHNVERAEAEKPLPPLHVAGASRRLERYKADFALQLKDLAYVEAADEAYLRDQAAALAPPELMPDGSRPPIDAHSRRPLIPAIQQVHKQRAEFLSLFDESEVEMAAAMFDSRPIEIARPLLFESEEDASAAEPPRRSASASRRRRRRRRRRGAGDEAAPADGAAEPAAAPRRPPRRSPSAADGAARRGARRGAGAGRRAGQEEEEAVARRCPAPPAEISEYERTRMRNIAAGNKKLYSLGLIHPPPEVVADPEHSWWSERARTRVFFVRAFDARAPAGPVVSLGPRCHPQSSPVDYPCMHHQAPQRSSGPRPTRPAPRPDKGPPSPEARAQG